MEILKKIIILLVLVLQQDYSFTQASQTQNIHDFAILDQRFQLSQEWPIPMNKDMVSRYKKNGIKVFRPTDYSPGPSDGDALSLGLKKTQEKIMQINKSSYKPLSWTSDSIDLKST